MFFFAMWLIHVVSVTRILSFFVLFTAWFESVLISDSKYETQCDRVRYYVLNVFYKEIQNPPTKILLYFCFSLV